MTGNSIKINLFATDEFTVLANSINKNLKCSFLNGIV